MTLDITDSHTHLDHPDFNGEEDSIVERALAVGVTRIITVGANDGFASAETAIRLSEKFSCVWASVGVHPIDGATPFDIGRLKSLTQHPRVVAIGETGLDFYYPDGAPAHVQEQWFRSQIVLAKEIKKPLIIHSRNAAIRCLQILIEEGASEVGGVFHCYSEDAAFAEKLRAINFLVSFPGPITFKKADALRVIASNIPLEQIMVETDAPYMAPEPYRGRRCESAFVVETARALAIAKGVSLEKVAEVTTANAKRLFNIS